MRKPMDSGLYLGKVLVNQDDDHPNRLKIKLHGVYETGYDEIWAACAENYLGDGYGMYVIPEIGAEVVVAFLGNARECPVILGCIGTSKQKMPSEWKKEDNVIKMMRSKGGNVIWMDDTEKKAKIRLETPNGLTLTLDEEKQSIIVSDKDAKNRMQCSCKDGSIAIEAEKSLKLCVGGKAVLSADGNGVTISAAKVVLSADNQLELKSAQTKCSSQTLAVSASAQAKISSDGVMQLKGTMVKING